MLSCILKRSRAKMEEKGVLTLMLIQKATLYDTDAVTNLAQQLWPYHETDELFDAILLDAPCSATGTFRRHPEVLHIKTIDDVKEQTFLQQKLLNAAASRLKIGGVLLYSVCSIAKAEGEEQIQKFLAAHTNLRLVPIKQSDIEKYGNWRENIITKEGYIHTLPYVISGGMDAFFIAKLQRII